MNTKSHKPKLFKPTLEDKKRVAKLLSKNITAKYQIIVSEKIKVQGTKKAMI